MSSVATLCHMAEVDSFSKEWDDGFQPEPITLFT